MNRLTGKVHISILLGMLMIGLVVQPVTAADEANFYEYSVSGDTALELWVTENTLKITVAPEAERSEHLYVQDPDDPEYFFVQDSNEKVYSLERSAFGRFGRFVDERFKWMKDVRDEFQSNTLGLMDIEEQVASRESQNHVAPARFRFSEETSWNGHPAEKGHFVAGNDYRGEAVLLNPAPVPVKPEHRKLVRHFQSFLNNSTNVWAGLQNTVPLNTGSVLQSLPPEILRLASFKSQHGELELTDSSRKTPADGTFDVPDYDETDLSSSINQVDFDELAQERNGWFQAIVEFFEFLWTAMKNIFGVNTPPGDEPVLLVHGFLDTTDTFWWWILEHRLAWDAGYDSDQIYKINLEPIIGLTLDSPKDYAPKLKDKVEEILDETGANQVDIIGHSMGGLVSRWYLEELGGYTKVDDLVTLGTPHQGTNVSKLGFFTAGGRAMFPESDLIETLNEDGLAPGVEHTAVWGEWDEAYLHQENSKIPASMNGTNYEAEKTTHLALVWKEDVYDKYVSHLD